MGQYWYTVNLAKREYLHPHTLGSGLKLIEQVGNPVGPGCALLLLLAAHPEYRGGGDLDLSDPVVKAVVGRWVGDPVALIGDYAEPGDLAYFNQELCGFDAKQVYDQIWLAKEYFSPLIGNLNRTNTTMTLDLFEQLTKKAREDAERDGHTLFFTDISPLVAAAIERVLGGKFVGTGWRQWKRNSS